VTFYQGATEKRKYRQPITGDVIASATWAISPTGPTVGTPVNTSTTSTVMLSGVTAGKSYTLTPHIVGSSSQEYEPSEDIVIIAR